MAQQCSNRLKNTPHSVDSNFWFTTFAKARRSSDYFYPIKSLIGFLHSDWQIQMYYIALAPLVYVFIFYWLLPTSAAWLYSRGNNDAARKVILKLSGKFPEAGIDEEFIDQVEKSVELKMADSTGETFTQADLFKTPRMRMVTIVEMYQWFATTLGNFLN